MSTVFDKILEGEIPADVVYEDDRVLAFRDIQPQAPVHVLVIPKRRIVRLGTARDDETSLLGHCMWACRRVAEIEGIAASGFRVVTNSGADGGQSVDHLHFHVLGGRSMSWPPG